MEKYLKELSIFLLSELKMAEEAFDFNAFISQSIDYLQNTFIPSVFAMLSGIFISIDFLESLKGFQRKFTRKLKATVQKHPFPIGFAAIFFGILHWILFRFIFF